MAQNKKTMIDRKYHLFDAQGKVLGRLATQLATILIGKDKVAYAPHIDGGDFVVIINSDKVEVTGNKGKKKIYHRFSGYPGGITSINFDDQVKKDSRKVIWQAVYNMLPKNKLRARMLRRLLINKGAEHEQKIIHITHQ
ncbi:MAG: 50S ribosomal protein L13 [Candidatus Moranbacteria bacterium RIFCSPLOWO2_02_FULL_48_19]|nr:MAG: 50S ribosomal protein L13 [Candidatus Moranbacteria bacterium RIFCSPLOWO2_02_FULL_48_19]OGI30380.1 MAG: 50S ribosomal protein L13 [Candidatus Moranbacteria bacterium RIFCSPLOWO2_12_FULL_48_12]